MTIASISTPEPRASIELELSSPAFSGPLALLLELIESRKLPITEVSLAQVTDQFLERMRSLVGLDADVLADFLVVAARLLLIKSRALLPTRPPEPDQPDVAAELEQRLLEYRIFREAAESLRQVEELGRRSYVQQPPAEPEARPEPPLEPTPPDVLRAAMVRMQKALRADGQQMALAPRVSVQQRIDHLLSTLSTRPFVTFSELAGTTVGEVVATFLAILELLRRRVLRAHQNATFGEIHLSLAEPVPTAQQAKSAESTDFTTEGTEITETIVVGERPKA